MTVSLPQLAWHAFRREIWERDNGICGLCHEPVPFTGMHIDHIRPISQGGGHEGENLQASHARCNVKKGAGPSEDRIPKVKITQPTPDYEIPVYVTVHQIAEKLRLKPKTVRAWIKAGTIKRATMITKRAGWLVPQSEVERLMNSSLKGGCV